MGEWGDVVMPLKLRERERGLASHPDRDFARYGGIQDWLQLAALGA